MWKECYITCEPLVEKMEELFSNDRIYKLLYKHITKHKFPSIFWFFLLLKFLDSILQKILQSCHSECKDSNLEKQNNINK